MEWEHDPAHLEIINEAAVLYKAINPCFEMQACSRITAMLNAFEY